MANLSVNPTFDELSKALPIADFLRLQALITDPECRKYVRTVTEVLRSNRGNGQVAVIKYEPDTNPNRAHEDKGEIPTKWLNDPLSTYVGKIAKAGIGHRCLLFQLNENKSESQPQGFRTLVWIQVLGKVVAS